MQTLVATQPAAANGSSTLVAGPESISARILVTPDLAQRWLTAHAFPRQRPIDQVVVASYVAMLRAGRFGISTLKFCILDGQPILINGYHRLTAIVKAGLPLACMVEEHAAADWAAVNVAYANEDRNRVRTNGHMIRAVDLPAEVDLPEHWCAVIGAAERLIASDFGSYGYTAKLVNGPDRLDFIRAWAADGRRLMAAYSRSDRVIRRYLLRSPVMAVALVTMLYQEDKAGLFWALVAENDGLRRGSPEHSLLRWLADHPVGGPNDAVMYAKYVAACWNAAYEGRDLQKVIVKALDQPILILGTPYKR